MFLRSILLLLLLTVAPLHAFDADDLRSNLVVQTFFSTCNACQMGRQLVQNRPSVSEMRNEVYRVCAVVPSAFLPYCEHIGAQTVERMEARLAAFAADELLCDEFCGEKSTILSTQNICSVAHYFFHRMDEYVEYIMGDLKQMCTTSASPFQCIEEHRQKRPFINGFLRRSFVRIVHMVDPSETCNLDFKESPDAEQLQAEIDAEVLQRGPVADPAPPSKVTCQLCHYIIVFLQQILDQSTPTGSEVRKLLTDTIVNACVNNLHKTEGDCTDLAMNIVNLTNLLNNGDAMICGNMVGCIVD